MFVAKDLDGNRIKVEDAVKEVQYFCPTCNAKVEFHNGSIRQHHFKHWKKLKCLDNWDHDMSEWHLEWQNHFPVDNQEIIVKDDEEIHRADVICGKTVVEFQHSKMSPEEFQERNAFYTKHGYKIVWLFDLTEEIKNQKIEKTKKAGNYIWKYSFTTFSGFNAGNKDITVFFQFYDNDNDKNPCIKRLVYRNTYEKLTKDFLTNNQEFLTGKDFIRLITNGYFEKGLSENQQIDNKKNNIIIPESQMYGYWCNILVKSEGLNYHELASNIQTAINNNGNFIYNPSNIRVYPDTSFGYYSVIRVEFWAMNNCNASYNQTFNAISNVIINVPNCVRIIRAGLLGRKIRDIFKDKPSESKGLINLDTGADVYVKKDHIYSTIVYGRLAKNGKYPFGNYEIFQSEKKIWVEKFSNS